MLPRRELPIMLAGRSKRDNHKVRDPSKPIEIITDEHDLADSTTTIGEAVTWSPSSDTSHLESIFHTSQTHRTESPTTVSESTTPEVESVTTDVATIWPTTTTTDGAATISQMWPPSKWGPSFTITMESIQDITSILSWLPWQSVGVASNSMSTIATDFSFSPLESTILAGSTDTDSPVATLKPTSTNISSISESITTSFTSAILSPISTVPSTLPSSSPSVSDSPQSESTLTPTSQNQQSFVSVSGQSYTAPSPFVIPASSQAGSSDSITGSELRSTSSSSSNRTSESPSEVFSSTMAPDPSSAVPVTMTMDVSDTYNPVPVSDGSDSTSFNTVSESTDGSLATSSTSNNVWPVTTSTLSTSITTGIPITSTTDSSSTFSGDQSSSDNSISQYFDSTTLSATALSPTTFSESITSSPTATSQSSSSVTTAPGSVVPDFLPPLHHSGFTHHHPFVLPVILSLGIPLLIAGVFFTYRHYCPEHYAKTERYCPIRLSVKLFKNLQPILAIRQRRERNRGIMERQKRYITRRSRSRLWSRVPSTVGPPRLGQSMRDTEQEQDEWLRSDMLGQYGEKDLVSSPAAGISPSGTGTVRDDERFVSGLRKIGTGSSRSGWDKYFETGSIARPSSRQSVTSPRISTATSRLSMPPTRPLSGILQPVFSPFQTMNTYKPGQLTGDGLENTLTETEATKRMREMVRAQREKVLRDEAMEAAASLGTICHRNEPGESRGDFASMGAN